MYKHLAEEIIEMARYDLEVRARLAADGSLYQGYNAEMEQVHKGNTARLDEIIAAIGYPTQSKVGEEASEAAWLIIQHSISSPAFMKKCHVLICENAREVNSQNAAHVYDRLCYYEGRPQRYGTQFDYNGIYPVEDKMLMAQLREELGFPAIAEDQVKEGTPSDNHADKDPESDFNKWRKRVGWT